jgi:hypothetical protein
MNDEDAIRDWITGDGKDPGIRESEWSFLPVSGPRKENKCPDH